jgi:hypothetical protein
LMVDLIDIRKELKNNSLLLLKSISNIDFY